MIESSHLRHRWITRDDDASGQWSRLSSTRERWIVARRKVIKVLVVISVAALVALTAVACGRLGGGSPAAAPGDTAPLSPEATASGVEGRGRAGRHHHRWHHHRRRSHPHLPPLRSVDPARRRAGPLLVGLHGGTGWGTQFEANSGFDRLAEANGFVVVYPDGIGIGRNNDRLRTWNAGICCGPAQKSGVDDVAFVSQLIDEISGTHHIDPNRIFVTGHSNGAMLSYRLACELSDKIAAAAVVAGTLAVQPCTPSRPVSFMEIHGTADRNVPIDGGTGDRSISRVDYPSVRTGIATMAALAGCGSEPTVTSDGDITTTTWSGGDDTTAVKLVAITAARTPGREAPPPGSTSPALRTRTTTPAARSGRSCPTHPRPA